MYKSYFTRKRARFAGISGWVNIPYGTILASEDGYLIWQGKRLCQRSSQNAYDFFVQNDDGAGQERAELINHILNKLSKKKNQQMYWARIWADAICQKYRRREHDDFWVWDGPFYNAGLQDLQHIAELLR